METLSSTDDEASVIRIESRGPRQSRNTGGALAMNLLWPVEKRPPGPLRDDAYLDTIPVADLIQIQQAYQKQQKEASTDNGMHRDTKPATVNVKKGTDDCFERLTHARFDLRMPLSSWSTWWPRMPLERIERFKSLDLKVVGAESQISKSAINRMHDRAQPRQLKWFSKRNLNVSRAPVKEQRLRDGDSVYTTSEFDWVDLQDIKGTMDALMNFGIVSQQLWPMDQTPWIFLKLYTTYNWMEYGIAVKKRTAIICEHFDRVSAANADRAVGSRPPCDYEEQERILKMILAEEGLSQNPPITAGAVADAVSAAGGQANNQGQAKKNSQKGGRGGKKGGNGDRPPPVTPNGKKICYAWNRTGGCSNPPSTRASGCKSSRTGEEFAHVCSEWLATTKAYCMKGHPRHQHT